MDLNGDRDRTIYAMMVARIWKDPDYRKKFLADPKTALTREGINVTNGANLQVVEDSPTVKYVILKGDPAESQRQLAALPPLAEGQELRVVQSTDRIRYVVIPAVPAGVVALGASHSELLSLAADAGVEATSHDTTQSVEAETTEVTVTETSEVQDVETSTTVVAEAELVAT